MTDEREPSHDISVYVQSGYGDGCVWASATDGSTTVTAEVPYHAAVCDPFPTIAHNLRQRAIYQAIREFLREADPSPHPWPEINR